MSSLRPGTQSYPPKRLWAALTLLALAGIVAGHTVAYWLAYRDGPERAAQLVRSGHSYWEFALTAAVVTCLSGLFVAATGRFTRRSSTSWTSTAWVPTRLLIVQWVGFATLEVAERLLAGSSATVWTDPAFWIGLAILVVVAALGSSLLRGAERVGDLLSGSPRTPAVVAKAWAPPRAVAWAADPLLGPSPRAPPYSRRPS